MHLHLVIAVGEIRGFSAVPFHLSIIEIISLPFDSWIAKLQSLPKVLGTPINLCIIFRSNSNLIYITRFKSPPPKKQC